MCDVCCANTALSSPGPVTFRWSSAPDYALDVEAKGERAECAPALFRFRRRTPDASAAWSPWLVTDDLAGVMMRLRVDVKWAYVPEVVRAYVGGTSKLEDVIVRLGGTAQ
jgi:hypothetical protein